jgi:hypothetical protein
VAALVSGLDVGAVVVTVALGIGVTLGGVAAGVQAANINAAMTGPRSMRGASILKIACASALYRPNAYTRDRT